MNRLSELGKYRNTILSLLIANDEIVKAVGNNSENFLDDPKKNPEDLVYSNIYPYLYIPTAQDAEKAYITFTISDVRPSGNMYKFGMIEFYVFAHQSIIRTDEGLRTDYLASKIDEIFNQSRDFGIGKMQFGAMGDIKINQNHFGMCIKYKNCDFN